METSRNRSREDAQLVEFASDESPPPIDDADPVFIGEPLGE